jgi:hypothetical protein
MLLSLANPGVHGKIKYLNFLFVEILATARGGDNLPTSTQPPTPAIGPRARRSAAVDEPQPGERNAVAREHKVPLLLGAVDHHVIRPGQRRGDEDMKCRCGESSSWSGANKYVPKEVL